VLNDLVRNSECWPLIISNCELVCDRVHIYLDKNSTFQNVFTSILSNNSTYGHYNPPERK
ncbi:hypothetical protein L9F63_025550, partial [Diploptera punctata]